MCIEQHHNGGKVNMFHEQTDENEQKESNSPSIHYFTDLQRIKDQSRSFF